jgi:hypothetical protein
LLFIYLISVEKLQYDNTLSSSLSFDWKTILHFTIHFLQNNQREKKLYKNNIEIQIPVTILDSGRFLFSEIAAAFNARFPTIYIQ